MDAAVVGSVSEQFVRINFVETQTNVEVEHQWGANMKRTLS